MTKFHLVSVVILTLVSSIFSFPQQTDDLQPRVELLETAVAQLSARVKALETPVNIDSDSSKTVNPTDDSKKTEIDYEVASIDAKITESNNVYVKYAWILTVKNNGKQKLLFNANIEFLDADGFIVDQDFAYRLLIEPYATKKYTGAKLVNTSIAGNVTQISAKTNVVSFEDVENAIASPTENVTPTPIPDTGEIVTSAYKVTIDMQVNLRTGPGTDYQVAGITKKGEILTIIGVTDGWYLLDNGNWIFGQLIGEIPSSIPIVPTPTPDGETSESPTVADSKQQYSEHIVQLGDTIESIATKYHTTKETIIELNNISDVSLLFVGQKLRIPADTAQPKQLEAIGSTSFENSKYEVSIDSCEYQSTSDDKTFDRYLCVEKWKNKSSKGIVLKITIHLFDSDGIELTTSGTISSYAPDSGSTGSIKVLIDYPQAEQVVKYGVTVEEQ